MFGGFQSVLHKNDDCILQDEKDGRGKGSERCLRRRLTEPLTHAEFSGLGPVQHVDVDCDALKGATTGAKAAEGRRCLR